MGQQLQSNPDGNLGEEKSGEDAGDDIDTVVVQHHLPSDRDNSLPSHLNYPSSLDVLARELETENKLLEETQKGVKLTTWHRAHCR